MRVQDYYIPVLLLLMEPKEMSHLVCKGICTRYKAKRPTSGGRYQTGQRRCQACDIFISYEGIFCPCCKGRLRVKPRNKGKCIVAEPPRI